MKKKTPKLRLFSLFLTLLLAMSLFTGCSGTAEKTEDTAQEEEAVQEEETADSREITDMAGRKVTVPAEIDSVFSANPVSAIYLYTLVPDKLLAGTMNLMILKKVLSWNSITIFPILA